MTPPEIVVIHDKTLDRTTDGSGPVTQQSSPDLRALDAGGWFNPFFKRTKISTLGEILDLLIRYDGHAYLEFKSALLEPVLEQVACSGLLDRVFFWSFNRDFLVKLRQISPSAKIMARRQDYNSLDEKIADFGANIVKFIPTEEAVDIASLRGSDVQSMVAYMGFVAQIV